MVKRRRGPTAVLLLCLVLLCVGCAAEPQPPTAALPATASPTAVATPTELLPAIKAVALDRPQLPNYEALEFTIDLDAEYTNPYDAREVALDGLFTAPDGTAVEVPGFWDGQDAWRLRFTPSQVGDWQYQLIVQDARGSSPTAAGTFAVTPSNHHGWLQAGSWIDPAFSGRYLIHHDGTPFYGIGHADALNILADGFDVDDGVGLFKNMQETGENYVVWWPLYSNSPVGSAYDNYTASNMNLIDLVVEDAHAKGIFLIFTIWDHPQLRDETHAWGDGKWAGNGFNKLGTLDAFFTSDDAWAWQENFYRYVIARWGYSPAIGMWQTVSEINGTNAYDQTDAWHGRVNAYFVEHDPYRHPTTASMAGDVDWEAGHLTMDVPQVHVYALDAGPIAAAETVAGWTETMWSRAEKPNWIGEFGVGGNTEYPELFHHAIWAALASGAAMTPAEWNGGGFWGRMTPEMNADIARLAQFVADIPLAHLNPEALVVSSSDPEVRAWGVAGEEGGLFWVQDFALEGQPTADVRANNRVRQGVTLTLQGLADGRYVVTPYDTWQGVFLAAIDIDCTAGQNCTVALPDFQSDMAFRIVRN